MKQLVLSPIRQVSGTVRLPGSKSLTNRTLLLAALAQGETELQQPLASDDTQHMLKALETLGCSLTATPDGYRIAGGNGPFNVSSANQPISLFLGNAGTVMRPLTAALTLQRADSKACQFYLHGEPRMHERPINDLVDSLRALGADIRYAERQGYPPLSVCSTGLTGGIVSVRSDQSSQYLTSLLMVAPFAEQPVEIKIEGKLVSKPYIDMTIALMERFNVQVEQDEHKHHFRIPATGVYHSPGTIRIEGDASSASYFLAAGAISGGPVRVLGVGQPALQGDVAFAEVLAAMGAGVTYGKDWIEVKNDKPLQGVDLDLNHIPDAAMTLATTALFAQTPTHIRNIANWRIKETDRLTAMATELNKLGAKTVVTEDSLTVHPPARLKSATIATWQDHRIAMSFSLAALGDATITIQDPDCVNKTFPDYFNQLALLSRN